MKKNILFLIESLSGGGAEKVLTVLLKHFYYEKYEVTVCPIVDTGVYCDEVKKYATHYIPLVSYNGNVISRLWNRIKYKLVYSLLPLKWVYGWFLPKGNDVEIAFCEGYVTKLLAHANSSATKIAWVHTDLTNNPWPLELGIYKNVEEETRAYASYDKIVCVSNTVECAFGEKYGLNDRTCTIYNPIDVDGIRREAKSSACIKDAKHFNIISIGRLVPQKGYDRLLRVVRNLHELYPSVRMTILGDGGERGKLEQYISEYKMSEYVFLPGFIKNPYTELATSDLFVCSSKAEGYSLVVAEAMVLGIPVVSTNCSGPAELLGQGEYGLLVENSEEALYIGIKELIEDNAKLKTLQKKSLLRGDMFSVSETIRQIDILLGGG